MRCRVRYSVERRIPFPTASVWQVLADLRHFAENDPFHHDFAWNGERREGIGASFGLRHTYAPIFPFGSDRVDCLVTEWNPGEAQSILEANVRRYRSHTQRFSLAPLRFGDTLVRYDIFYRGIPWPLFPWRLWVSYWVKRRMRQKLEDIERRAAAAQVVAVTSFRLE